MSAAPILTGGNATDFRRSDQETPECPAVIQLECKGASVTVKPALDSRERQAAFRFLYEIYVEKENLIPPQKLPRECQVSRSRWDKWDGRPSTRHIVALVGDNVIGHLRLLYRKDGPLPLEEDGYRLLPDAREECELSKLALNSEFRRADILAAFYRHIFQICRNEQHLTSAIFGCQPKHEAVYARFGAVSIGSFMNTQLGALCAVMRMPFVDDFAGRLRGFVLGARYRKSRAAPVHNLVTER